MAWPNRKSVLVPVDFGDASFEALEESLTMVEEPGHVHMIHVVPNLEGEPAFIRNALDGAPFILPLGGALRGALDAWFERKGVRPSIVGRFDDSALTKVFGEAGAGLFAGPSVIEADIRRQYGVEVVGRTDELHDQFYVISVERRLKHSGVVAISNSARESLFN
jgi:DNA-binding transcriptional LysR family regulator